MGDLFEATVAEGFVHATDSEIERTVIWLEDNGIRNLSVVKMYPMNAIVNEICYPLVMGALAYQESNARSVRIVDQ